MQDLRWWWTRPGISFIASRFSGNSLIDDSFLFENGVRDFDQYRVDPNQDLLLDIFVPDDMPSPPGVCLQAKD